MACTMPSNMATDEMKDDISVTTLASTMPCNLPADELKDEISTTTMACTMPSNMAADEIKDDISVTTMASTSTMPSNMATDEMKDEVQTTTTEDKPTVNQESKPTLPKPADLIINGMRIINIPAAPPQVKFDLENFNKVLRKSFKAIQQGTAIRIAFVLPTLFLDWMDFLASARTIITPYLTAWTTNPSSNPGMRETNKVHFLAVDVQPVRSYAAVEINNHAYDFETAHEQELKLPVYVLRLSGTLSEIRGTGRWKFYRCPGQDQRVLNDLKSIHLNHGFEETPLLDVRLSPLWPPIYDSPRR